MTSKPATRSLLLPLTFLALSIPTRPARAEQPTPTHLTLHPNHPAPTPINPLFFGTNTLFMYDTKPTLSNPTLIHHLQKIPIRLLRFPGGDVADNYYWDEHRLDDPTWWPRTLPPDSADTDAFMTFCRKVGAEPLFVVNLESGFVHHDLDSAIKRAAAWVNYCNRQHDYHVKYWEIGNETFWYHPGKHKRTRVTAAEYGQAFARFATAMKAVDPTIQLGAVGPANPTTSANNTLPDGSPASPKQPPWWPTVLQSVAPDFVTVHAYPGGANQTYASFIRRGVWGGESLPSLRSFLDQTLHRHVPIALTEWNLDPKVPLHGLALAQAQTTLLCRFLSAGVDMACSWPLRLPHADPRSLLDYHTLSPQPLYHVLSLLSPALSNTSIIPSDSTDPALFHFATLSPDKRTLTLLLIPKSTSDQPHPITITCPAPFTPDSATGQSLTAPTLDSPDLTPHPLTPHLSPTGTCSCTLPPYSICLLQLTRHP